ncbi:androgen-induced gene 1 protein-like isoform X2 [Oratosquilla oratoria]|uniref:androgen-induced gene 1 protein-like isoform X2 n=1 Tax=Oratosquilla oratoria TaxID=337810 RepID=UPI003F757D20
MGVQPLIHFTLLVHYAYGIYVYKCGITPPEELRKIREDVVGGLLKYLTYWDMLLQCLFFGLALLNDIIGSSSRDPRKQTTLQKIIDFLFATLVFSCGAFVTTSFWSLYNINRDLIYPKIFDTWFPVWLNHNIHTTPLIGVIMESYLTYHKYPSRGKGFFTVAFFCLAYLVWVCYIAHVSNHWVYPILAKLTVIGRVAFISAMCILVGIFYLAGEKLNQSLWGKDQVGLKKIK